jgi:DNA-binding transcriptional ArsR family regulator
MSAILGLAEAQVHTRLRPLRYSGLVIDRSEGTTKRYALTEPGRVLMDAARALFAIV